MTKESLKGKILEALKRLAEQDGMLFGMPLEEYSGQDERKLHEVCINHRLAGHLAELIIPEFEGNPKLFADLEFNREGVNFKKVNVGNDEWLVRPDIIVHNRRPGESKFNFLIVECKKADSLVADIERDKEKICALMADARYSYQYGLQVLYGQKTISGLLFYHSESKIVAEPILYPENKIEVKDNPK